MTNDDWRIRIELPDEEGAHGFLEQLGLARSDADELASELREQRLAVSHDVDTVFVYASSGAQAEQASRIVERELQDAGATPTRLVTEHWLSGEERWDDEQPQKSWEQEEIERGYAPWEVRVDCASLSKVVCLAEALAVDAHLPRRVAALDLLLLPGLLRLFVVPTLFVREPVLGDETRRCRTCVLQLPLDDAACLLGLRSGRGVDEDGVPIVRDRKALRAERARELVGVAACEPELLEEAVRAFLVRQLDANAPVVVGHVRTSLRDSLWTNRHTVVTRRDSPCGLRRGCLPPLESFAQVLELPAVRSERLAMELHDDPSTRRDEPSLAARVEQPAVGIETVAGRVHGVRRLVVVARVVQRVAEVRQIRDHDVHRQRHRLEQIAVHDVHAIRDAVPLRIRPRELDRRGIRVRGPELGVRPCDRKA